MRVTPLMARSQSTVLRECIRVLLARSATEDLPEAARYGGSLVLAVSVAEAEAFTVVVATVVADIDSLHEVNES